MTALADAQLWWAQNVESRTGAERLAVLQQIASALPPYRLLYNPPEVVPHPKQAVFLSTTRREVFYGGAAGPGKSTALFLGALQYVDVPSYAAILFRRTYADLALPGALIDVAHQWLGPTDAKWNQSTHTWTFPSGAKVTFGHLEREAQKRRYASTEFQYIGWDELTHFTETMYTFLFSRLRRPSFPKGGTNAYGLGIMDVPLRMRSASNPGGDGHEWVKSRFVEPATREPGAIYMPARMHENPSLDREEYLKSLAMLSPVERERLLEGDWDAADEGGMFWPDDWELLDRFGGVKAIRRWDLAGSKPTAEYPDPDYSSGMRLEINDAGEVCITDVVRFREDPATTEAIVAATADADGRDVPVSMEQEPGQSGKAQVSHYSRKVLQGKAAVYATPSTRDKVTRARPVAAAAGRGEVKCLRRPWTKVLYGELRRFPQGKHDDQVDCLSGGYSDVARLSGKATVSVSTARLPGPTGSDDQRGPRGRGSRR